MVRYVKELDSRLIKETKALLSTGFGYVFFSSVACNVLSFLGGMIVVRILPKADYGDYTYIMNCFNMTALLSDFGCGMAVMQRCNENYQNREKFNAFYTFGFRCAMRFSLLTALLIVASPLFYPFQDTKSARLTQILFLMPFLTTANSLLLINLRVRLENKRFAAINIFQTVIHYFVIVLLTLWLGVRGAVLSNYLIALLVLGFSLWISRSRMGYDWKQKTALTSPEKRAFLKFALASQANSALSHALVLLDIFLIGLIVGKNVVISSYKVGSTIPSALAFVPGAVMTYAVPYFARNRGNRVWVRRNYGKLIFYSACGNAAIMGVLIFAGPWLVPFVFGAQYRDAVVFYSILMVGYFFSATFQTPSSNVIYTQGKVRVNIIITIAAGLANCIADIILIKNYGSVGAAIATTAVHILASALSFGYMLFYLKEDLK